MVVAKAAQPLLAAYHLMAVPVAERLATVGLAVLQKLWAAEPVGVAGLAFTVAVTSSLLLLSQPLVVWLA